MAFRLFVSAGEASGDRHAAALVRALRRRVGEVEVRGLGGDALAKEGAELLATTRELSVIGFAEVLKRLPYFSRLMKRTVADIRAWQPHALLPVDYPGFNLRLSRRVRGSGPRVIYYIAPQVWAWKRERRPGIARAVDDLLVVFPFEEPLFKEAGIATRFVGHPLLDQGGAGVDAVGVRARLEAEQVPLLALLPGSRSQEVSAILPALLAGTDDLAREGVRLAVSRAPGLEDGLFSEAERRGVSMWEGAARDLTEAADAALVASGTATLETGLTGTPLAVVYRTGRINWWLARALVSVRTVGLVNIAAGGSRVPELLQSALTPEAVRETARRLLFDEREREEQSAYLAGLRERLGGSGAAERAADAVEEILGMGRGNGG